MYKALKTIILEDVLGRDNQYLKGHKYDLTYQDWTAKEHYGGSIKVLDSHPLLSNEDMEKYFEYEEPAIIRGVKVTGISR